MESKDPYPLIYWKNDYLFALISKKI